MSDPERRPQGHASSSLRRLALLGFSVSILLGAPRASAQVTATPGLEVFSAPGTTAVFSMAVSPGTTLGSFSVLTMGAPGLDYTSVPSGTTCPNVVGGRCTVVVQFRPTAPGRRQGAVVLKDQRGNPLLSVSLDGVAEGTLLAFGPGQVSTFAGTGTGADGGPASAARLVGPTGIAVDGLGNHYVADQADHRVRKVTPAGIISTFAGTGVPGYSGDGGPATSAQLSGPMSVLVDGAGFVYIADTGNNVVRMVDPAGTISTYAGQYYAPGTAPPPVCAAATNAVGDGCPGNQMVLNTPVDLVFCKVQNLHISDKLNNRVRTILRTTYQTITQVGNGTAGYNGDGGLNTSAELDGPTGMAMDGANYIYVADSGNHLIRKTLLTGTTPNPISTVAGTPGGAGTLGDGAAATSSRLGTLGGVQVDPAGDLYLSDLDGRSVRKVNAATGLISTIAGPGGSLEAPSGLLLDEAGDLYVADSQGAAIRTVGVSEAPSLTFDGTTVGAAGAPQDVTVMNLGNAPATLSGISAPAGFSLGGPDTSCSLTGDQALGPATSCILGIVFTPTTMGTVGGSVVLTEAPARATYSIHVSGSVAPSTAPAASGGCGGGPAGPWSMALLGLAWLARRRWGSS